MSLGGSLAFQTREHVLKLPASQVPQMAVPYQVWPTHTALTIDPTLFSNSPTQCNNMNVTSLNRFLKYSYCRLTSRRGFTVQSLSRALPFPLLTHLYCTRKKLLHNLPWPPHEENALQLRTSKSVCLLKGFYSATIELLGKITNQCVNSADLLIKLDLRLHSSSSTTNSKDPQTSKPKVCAYHELVLHPGTTLASCFWVQKLLLSHAEDLCRLIHSDQRGFPLGEFPLFLSGILDKIKELSHYW